MTLKNTIESGSMKNWKDNCHYQLVLPNSKTKWTIDYQEHAIQSVKKTLYSKTLYSKGPFRIKTTDGSILASNGINPFEPLVKVIVWKDRHGMGIKSDGTETYKLPLSRANNLPNVYWDEINKCYGVDDRKVY